MQSLKDRYRLADPRKTDFLVLNEKRKQAGLSNIKVTSEYVITEDTLKAAAIIDQHSKVLLFYGQSCNDDQIIVRRLLEILNYPPFRTDPTGYIAKYKMVFRDLPDTELKTAQKRAFAKKITDVLEKILSNKILQFTDIIHSDDIPLTQDTILNACILDRMNGTSMSAYKVHDIQQADTHISRIIKSNDAAFSV